MSSLYEINSQLLECIDKETGEIINVDQFDALQLEQKDKIEGIALWYKNLLSEADQYKNEKNLFADREKRATKTAESLKNYLDTVLHGNKFNTIKVNITYRKSSNVDVTDLDKLPDEYKKTKTEVSADKTEIAKAIKDGKTIDGAEIVESNNIQIK